MEVEPAFLTDTPFVSVIILNYNGEKYLSNCLNSVLKNHYKNYEVVLVDNASTDASMAEAERVFGGDPRLRIIRNSANLGFSGGNNVGYKQSKGEYLVFLNNDTVVDEYWLSELVNAMQSDPSIGLAQSKILNMHNEQIQIGGWVFSNYLVRKHPLGQNKTSSLKFQSVFEVSVASGASMIAPRELIDEVGLFDERIPFFYDDTLLSFKVWLANRRVVTVENSKIRHILGASAAWNVENTTFNLQRAKTCLLFDVYYHPGELAKASFVNAIYSLVNTLYALRNHNLGVIRANIHSFTWTLRNMRFLWQNRIAHWSKTKVSPDALKEKFVRIHLPTALYLFSSKLSDNSFLFAVGDYEKAVSADRESD